MKRINYAIAVIALSFCACSVINPTIIRSTYPLPQSYKVMGYTAVVYDTLTGRDSIGLLGYGDTIAVLGEMHPSTAQYTTSYLMEGRKMRGYVRGSAVIELSRFDEVVLGRRRSSNGGDSTNSTNAYETTSTSSRTLHVGPRGGVYTISPSGKKVYVKKRK